MAQTAHAQPTCHVPRRITHRCPRISPIAALSSACLCVLISSQLAWLGVCAGEDPFLFIDKRGAFHILAHVYGVQQYPLNPISGPRKNSSLSRFRSSSFCGWWPFFRFVPSLSWQDVFGFSNLKTHRRAFTLQVTRLAQTAPTTAGPSPRQSHTRAQKAFTSTRHFGTGSGQGNLELKKEAFRSCVCTATPLSVRTGQFRCSRRWSVRSCSLRTRRTR